MGHKNVLTFPPSLCQTDSGHLQSGSGTNPYTSALEYDSSIYASPNLPPITPQFLHTHDVHQELCYIGDGEGKARLNGETFSNIDSLSTADQTDPAELPPLDDLVPLSPPSPDSSSPSLLSPAESTSSSHDESPSSRQIHRVQCTLCIQTFANKNSLNRHQDSVHGRKEAEKLLSREIKWWQARALMDMAVRKHAKNKKLKRTLKEAVSFSKERGVANVRRYEEAFDEYARWWLESSTCPVCHVVFSRRDAADRKHHCVSLD
jgi:hypothetical protein